MKKSISCSLGVFLGFMVSLAQAAPPTSAAKPASRYSTDSIDQTSPSVSKPQSGKASPAKATASKGSLWDKWYTITIGGSVPYAYYNEKVERKEGRIFYYTQMWKREEGFVNEESMGAYAEDNEELTPAFFNFRSVYRTTETNIDGTVQQPNRLMSVKIRKGGQEMPLIRQYVTKGVMLSSHFPVWMTRKLAELKPGMPKNFYAILEDNTGENGFSPVTGQVRLEKPDAFAQKSGTQKVFVSFRGIDSFWYMKSGQPPIRMEIPAQNAVVEEATHAEAEKFFNRPVPADASE